MRGKSTEFTRGFDDDEHDAVLRQEAPRSGNSDSRCGILGAIAP